MRGVSKFQDALNRAHNFGFRVIIHETDITLVKDEGSIKIRREGGRSMHACEPFAGDTVNAHRYPAGVVEEIRHRAYQIWEEWGKCSDGALDDWLRAEAEILSHRVMRRVA